MAILVIAPNARQYYEFIRQEAEKVYPHAVNFRRCADSQGLAMHHGELIVVNSEQCDKQLLSEIVPDILTSVRYAKL